MPERTQANKDGHAAAEKLGFRSLGPEFLGWKNAEVECINCGYRAKWYHRVYQINHREKCELSTDQAMDVGIEAEVAAYANALEKGQDLHLQFAAAVWASKATDEDSCGARSCDGGCRRCA